MADPRVRLDQPKVDRRRRAHYDAEAFGRVTERIARFLGTGRYLVIQSIIIIIWIAYNATPGVPHFDPYPLQFLTLILSLQAAYSAPLILLAQNRQDDRDRVNLEADRIESRQAKADLEYVARELASIRMTLGEVPTRDFLRAELSRVDDRRDERNERAERAERAEEKKRRKAERREELATLED